jgi:hypothetical protein
MVWRWGNVRRRAHLRSHECCVFGCRPVRRWLRGAGMPHRGRVASQDSYTSSVARAAPLSSVLWEKDDVCGMGTPGATRRDGPSETCGGLAETSELRR